MIYQHKKPASERWKKLTFVQQMANIGSEVERAISWKNKGNNDYSRQALIRALQLLELTIDSQQPPRFKELTRLYEMLVDYFVAGNTFSSTDKQWQKYFLAFNYAARINS